MAAEDLKLINPKDLGFEGKGRTIGNMIEIPNADYSRVFELIQGRDSEESLQRTRIALTTKFVNPDAIGDGAPLFEVYVREYDSGEVNCYLSFFAVKKTNDPYIWQQVRYDQDGKMKVGYTTGIVRDMFFHFGIGGEDMRKKAKTGGHKTLDEFPEKIYFFATMQGLIEQAKALDFSDPKLIPANPLNPSSVGTA